MITINESSRFIYTDKKKKNEEVEEEEQHS